jgi:hypothetical protein
MVARRGLPGVGLAGDVEPDRDVAGALRPAVEREAQLDALVRVAQVLGEVAPVDDEPAALVDARARGREGGAERALAPRDEPGRDRRRRGPPGLGARGSAPRGSRRRAQVRAAGPTPHGHEIEAARRGAHAVGEAAGEPRAPLGAEREPDGPLDRAEIERRADARRRGGGARRGGAELPGRRAVRAWTARRVAGEAPRGQGEQGAPDERKPSAPRGGGAWASVIQHIADLSSAHGAAEVRPRDC